MELNITQFFYAADPATYSASVAEIGENAGRILKADDGQVYFYCGS